MNARVLTGLDIVSSGFAVLVVLAAVIRPPRNPGVSLPPASDRLPAVPEISDSEENPS
jgi:hypothetical protein